MRVKLLAGVALLVAASGCYHVTVVTGAPPSAQVINKEWQNSFVYGLVPPAELNAKDTGAQGVAKVETERSFLNSLVAGVLYNLYTPLHVTVTCASRPVAR